ncbi:hypothetical protein D3C85_1725570 [compost metagenome]
MISDGESSSATPHCLSLAMFSSLKIRSQLSTGAFSPSTAFTLSGLKPIRTVPYM